MSTAAIPLRASYQDVLDAPEGQIAEIIDGEFYLQARPADAHIAAVQGLIISLDPPFMRGRGGPGGWWIRAEAQFDTGNRDWRTLAPDVAGWRKERVPTLPRTYFEIAPDWVCEVLSPSTRLHDRNVKAEVYRQEGVKHLWLVDPSRQVFEAYENAGDEWRAVASFQGAEGEVSAPPFSACPFLLADLWTTS